MSRRAATPEDRRGGRDDRREELGPGTVRRALDELVAGLARLVLRVFFHGVGVTGLDRLPRGVPVVVVANHNNSVVDSLVLMALPGARLRLLAKSTLFSHPVMGPLLALVGALPVYRRHDASADVARNRETFALCRAVLAAGGQVALFPEGTSHNHECRLPLKTGAARIVLEGEEGLGPLGVRVVAVGIWYEHKERFRSRVSVHVGPAIDAAPWVARYRAERGATVRALTERIGAGLDEAVRAATEAGALRAAPFPPSRRSRLERVAWPFLFVGCALNWLPYRFPGWVSDRLSTTPDEPATYKLLGGLLAFPIVWAVEAALAFRLAGPVWAAVLLLIAPTSGYAALRMHERRGGRHRRLPGLVSGKRAR